MSDIGKTISIRLTFLEPYRLVEWIHKEKREKDRRWPRGQSFARWHMNGNGSDGMPFITGTLLRSAVLRAAEELISLDRETWKDCCNGEFKTNQNNEKTTFLRKRHTLQWDKDKEICNPHNQRKDDACPFCILLGRFDHAGKNHKDHKYPVKTYDIHFGNLDLVKKQDLKSLLLRDIAIERIVNRVDFKTRKAHDYFRIWEVDHEEYGAFTGVITSQDERAEALLTDSLRYVDKLCGALCRIEIMRVTGKNNESPPSKDKSEQSKASGEKGVAASVSKGDSEKQLSDKRVNTELKNSAIDIVAAFVDAGKLEKARLLADAVRAMRLRGPDILEQDELPRKRECRENSGDYETKEETEHHLWDKIKIDNEPLWKTLTSLWVDNKENIPWRTFCNSLGNEIYKQYKEKTGGLSDGYRILGETEYYSKQDIGVHGGNKGHFVTVSSGSSIGAVKEWIIVGTLKSETPFFFGFDNSGRKDNLEETAEQDKDSTGLPTKVGQPMAGSPTDEGNIVDTSGEQTSFTILLDRKGRYRIPRSLMRGVIRRDLRIAFGDSGCNVELGGATPCVCNVCAVMRKITVKETRSNDYDKPPEIRHRIRLNPYTSVVDEGALFDIEVGQEGITFDFVLRYRGDALPDELWSVIHYWKDGMAFLGGSRSTGKGRFALTDIEVFGWNLQGDGLKSYLACHGKRGKEADITKETYPDELKNIDLPQKDKLTPYTNCLKPLWTEVKYEIEIASPLLTADPVEALLDPENRDTIAFVKRRILDNGSEDYVHAVKGETIRGIVRTAVGKRSGTLSIDDHEDCSCALCDIFGNEHEAGKMLFEDLEIRNAKSKKIDHVAIDRFTGGTVDKKKFDTWPLVADSTNTLSFGRTPDATGLDKTPESSRKGGSTQFPENNDPINRNQRLVLKGRLWIRKEILTKQKDVIKSLEDIREGLYPIGGKTGIGYGWVTNLRIVNPQNGFTISERGEVTPAERTYCNTYSDSQLIDFKPDHFYYPHYFLEPHPKVKREYKLIGHDQFHKEFENQKGEKEKLASGKIECTLETLTPLIIPDTESCKVDEKGHRRYESFRINGEEMIPGSEIRGVVSSVYEAITNSCFRIFDEGKYLSRRIDPKDQNLLKKVIPGRVKIKDSNIYIEKIEKEYRLPLYDSLQAMDNFDIEDYIENNKSREEKIRAANKCNKNIANVASINMAYLKSNSDMQKMLKGEIKVKFKEEPINKKNPHDNVVAQLDNNGDKEGFIKFSGLNMVNISNISSGTRDEGFDENWDIWSLNILLNDTRFRNSQKQEYPRPFLGFKKDGKEYKIDKRCERLFVVPDNGAQCYKVSKEVQNQYNDILYDYDKNFGHIDERFKTLIKNCTLDDGNLVYFIPDKHHRNVLAITPVRISRITDNIPQGKRLPNDSTDLRPCERDILDKNVNPDSIKDSSLKKLFSLHPSGLCPACRLFGTTSYKGRVRFGFAKLENEPKWINNNHNVSDNKTVTLPLLERPRPTWPMPHDKAKVPGRKFYVHHNGWNDILNDQVQLIKGRNRNNRTVEALDKGNTFKFEISFENLREWELGLLLYSLELEHKNNMAHKIGMGKPLGFGSAKITVDQVLTHDSNCKWEDGSGSIDKWLEKGFNKLSEWFEAEDWQKISHIEKLRNLLRFQELGKFRYPKLESEDRIPGYVDLLKRPVEERMAYLTTPGVPWHPP